MSTPKRPLVHAGRRDFFKQVTLVAAALIAAPGSLLRSGLASAADAALPALSPSDATATALGYHPNASKVDVKKWPKRAGAEGKQQTCSNCMFFSTLDKTTGKCQIFPKNSVQAKGWCNTWSKKA